MNTYYAYVRVSTARQGDRGVSLPEQRDAIARYAQRHGFTIAKWFEEQQSAATGGRPTFARLLEGLAAGKAAGVIIHKIDRSARNLRDWNDVSELVDRGIDVHFAHDGLDLRSRSGRLSADIQAVVAADFSRNLRDETRKGLNGRLKQGLWPRPAPLGYLNQGSGKPKVPDPRTAPGIRHAFTAYASGDVSLEDLRYRMNEDGLTQRSGRLLTVTQVSRILRDPFYTGVLRIKKSGETYAGIHEPLISSGLFQRVQDILDGKAPRLARVHNFQYRRLLRCAGCQKRLIGEMQKGHVYYRCHTRGCPTTTVREEAIDAHVRELLAPLEFVGRHFDNLVGALAELRLVQADSHEQQRQSRQLRLDRVSSQLSRLTDVYLDGTISADELQKRKTALLAERRAAELDLESSLNAETPIELAWRYLELAKRLCLLHENASLEERRELIEIVTSNRLIEGRTPMFTLAFPFASLGDSSESQHGAPRRGTTRTRATVRRLIKMISSRPIDSKHEEKMRRLGVVAYLARTA